jgi:geranyl-CoA carboxylase alpha subunit
VPSITNIMVANRGEIAVRIMRTAHALGFSTTAVYSDADKDMPHVALADRAVHLGPAPADKSYLDITKVINAAKRAGADAIHPGYGFLSENADFALACEEAGIIFIGPTPHAIRSMGDKAEAKRLMIAAGVLCVPGYDGDDQSPQRMAREAERIGYPVMIKAVAGGGGKGIMLEKAIVDPRHVEVQIFADVYGNAVHIGDRDCSVQRRHQKVIEEAPAPSLASDVRRAMGDAAVKAALAVNYRGAGTVEFLVDKSGNFYFLEMNTRLQVEHPVTEMVSGLDLVEWQIKIASGEPLPLGQADIRLSGHSIEVRLYAEDPEAGFLPQSGRITAWAVPTGEGIRVDHGLRSGVDISTYYDPMIAKIIATGRTREESRRRLVRALDSVLVGGLANNRNFLKACLIHSDFVEGRLGTSFIERNIPQPEAGAPPQSEAVATAAVLLRENEVGAFDPALRGWRSNPWHDEPIALRVGDWAGSVRLATVDTGFHVTTGDRTHSVAILARDGHAIRVRIDGVEENAFGVFISGDLDLMLRGARHSAALLTEGGNGIAAHAGNTARAPMPGVVVSLRVSPGDKVKKGDVLLVMEAMKMEHIVSAPIDGIVAALNCVAGQQVPLKFALAEISPTTDRQA